MKYSVILAAAFAAVASAQATRDDLPECARPCIIDAIGTETDCDVEDISCSCVPENNTAIRAKATTCVLANCEGADITKTLEVSGQLCVGVPPPSEEPEPSAEPTEEPEPTAEPTEEPEPTAEPTEDPEPTAEPTEDPEPTAEPTEDPEPTDVGEAPETVYVTVCDSSSSKVPVPTGNGTAPTNPPAPTFTGAANKMAAGLGSVAALALAAIAL